MSPMQDHDGHQTWTEIKQETRSYIETHETCHSKILGHGVAIAGWDGKEDHEWANGKSKGQGQKVVVVWVDEGRGRRRWTSVGELPLNIWPARTRVFDENQKKGRLLEITGWEARESLKPQKVHESWSHSTWYWELNWRWGNRYDDDSRGLEILSDLWEIQKVWSRRSISCS